MAGNLPERAGLRPVEPTHVVQGALADAGLSLLGPAAEAFHPDLESRRAPCPVTQTSWGLARAEIAEETAGVSTAEMDSRFGVCGRHPPSRHAIWQLGECRSIERRGAGVCDW